MRMVYAALALLVCAWGTHRAVRAWQSDEALWSRAVTVSPNRPRALLNAGVECAAKYDWPCATDLFSKAVTSPPQNLHDGLAIDTARENLRLLPLIEASVNRHRSDRP